MRRPTLVPLHEVKFPLTLADGLQAAFDNVGSTPLPERLAALMERLNGDELSGERDHGASATATPSRINRRRRR
jgi:hypothetical protein